MKSDSKTGTSKGASTKKKSSRPKEYDYFMKIVLVGASSVGKSSLMLRFTDDKFNETYVNTIGVDFRFRTLEIDGKKVKIQIWDTAGQEKFRTMTSTYYRGAEAILVVYDITDPKSFDDITSYWTTEIAQHANEVPFLVMIGNKSDKSDLRKVDPPAGDFTDMPIGEGGTRPVRTIEVSAKSSLGVYEIFEELAIEFIRMKEENRAARREGFQTNPKHLQEIKELSIEESEKGNKGGQITKSTVDKDAKKTGGCKC